MPNSEVLRRKTRMTHIGEIFTSRFSNPQEKQQQWVITTLGKERPEGTFNAAQIEVDPEGRRIVPPSVRTIPLREVVAFTGKKLTAMEMVMAMAMHRWVDVYAAGILKSSSVQPEKVAETIVALKQGVADNVSDAYQTQSMRISYLQDEK